MYDEKEENAKGQEEREAFDIDHVSQSSWDSETKQELTDKETRNSDLLVMMKKIAI